MDMPGHRLVFTFACARHKIAGLIRSKQAGRKTPSLVRFLPEKCMIHGSVRGVVGGELGEGHSSNSEYIASEDIVATSSGVWWLIRFLKGTEGLANLFYLGITIHAFH